MNIWHEVYCLLVICFFSQSCFSSRQAEKVSPDSEKVNVKIDEVIYKDIEHIEFRKFPKGTSPLAKELFPNAELIWSRAFEGRMTDCMIAAKSGHVLIGGVKNWKGFVYLFNPEGEVLWKKESSINSSIKKCGLVYVNISDNGSTIGVIWGGDYERSNVQVYNMEGNRTFEYETGMGAYIKISPHGEYLDCDRGIFSYDGKRLDMRNLLQKIPSTKPAEHFDFFTFDSDSEVVTQIRDNLKIYFLSFPGGQLKWEREIETSGKILTSENYILTYESGTVILFDKKGNILWTANLENKFYATSFSFSEDESYIGIHQGGGHFDVVVILDTDTGQQKTNIDFSEGGIDQFPPYFLCLNDIITMSGITGASVDNRGEREGYYTYFIKFGNNKKILDNGWQRGLVIGTSTSPFIGVYESDATERHPTAGENSTKFTINILQRKAE